MSRFNTEKKLRLKTDVGGLKRLYYLSQKTLLRLSGWLHINAIGNVKPIFGRVAQQVVQPPNV